MSLKIPVIALSLSATALGACDAERLAKVPGDEHGESDSSGEADESDGSDSSGEADESDGSDSSGDSGSSDEEEPCDPEGEPLACPGSEDALRFCDWNVDQERFLWGPCVQDPECLPGETEIIECDYQEYYYTEYEIACELEDGVPYFPYFECPYTPLVLDFGRGIQLDASAASTFDISVTGGSCVSTDWPTADTPWLALDLDGNGSIDDGRELFGSGTRLPEGGRARDGFAALSQWDENLDGAITIADSVWPRLVAWGDLNGDRMSTPAELTAILDLGLTEISLGVRIEKVCDARGNCGVERAAFTVERGGQVSSGEVVNLWLSCQ